MKGLIVGLGIGSVYLEQLNLLGFNVTTVDIDKTKNPTFLNIEDALKEKYDLSIICTPNYLHFEQAKLLQPASKNILIEKPGFESLDIYNHFINTFKDTKFFIVKNNIYRPELTYIKSIIDLFENSIEYVSINWLNSNRTPYPGGWFTNKEKSFGGVCHDLMPHLLHLFYSLNGNKLLEPKKINKFQRWNYTDVLTTEYGNVNSINPVYDVDDTCQITFEDKFLYKLNAAWKTDKENDISININLKDGRKFRYEFGLCPNEMYGKMISEIMSDNNYSKHILLDTWLHKIINS